MCKSTASEGVCVRIYYINVCMHTSHTGGSMVSENEDIGNECSVCMDNKKNHVLIPCAHVCVCELRDAPVRLLLTFT